jgi:hypothetical protein
LEDGVSGLPGYNNGVGAGYGDGAEEYDESLDEFGASPLSGGGASGSGPNGRFSMNRSHTVNGPPQILTTTNASSTGANASGPTSRERKASLPLSARTFSSPQAVAGSSHASIASLGSTGVVVPGSAQNQSQAHVGYGAEVELTTKQLLRELRDLAREVNAVDSGAIAEEITRLQVGIFLDIEPRAWLRYAFLGKRDLHASKIVAFNEISSHLGDWVVSLILCHDRPTSRSKQIEKFVEVAQKLRELNNYSGLRSFVAGINSATFSGDQTMEVFRVKCPEGEKNLRSWDILLRQAGSHRTYRLALKNTKGACIPAQEVHLQDLIKTHEANPDFSPDDPTKIHWGKFSLIGKFISTTMECQTQCRNSMQYNFEAKPGIQALLGRHLLMSDDMQKSRMAPSELDPEPESGLGPSRPLMNSGGNGRDKDLAILRKLFFW